MRFRAISLFLSLLLLVGGISGSPAFGQIYGGSTTSPPRSSTPPLRSDYQFDNSPEREPSLGTVPGIYYDPSGQLSPSLQDLNGASEPGVISHPPTPTDYNMQRAWPRGATPDRIIKVGDIQNDPTLSQVIDLNKLTLRQVATNGGVNVDELPIKSIGFINNMTVGEYFETFPQLKNVPVRDVSILSELVTAASQNPQGTAIDLAEKTALEQLAKIDPRLSQVPVAEILNGNWDEVLIKGQTVGVQALVERYPILADVPITEVLDGNWDGVLAKGQTVAIGKLVERYPVLANVPISDVLNGNWQGTAIDLAEKTALEQLAKIDPRLGEVPISAILNGDWDSVLAKGQTIAIEELVERYPVLKDAPISEVLNGDWDSVLAKGQTVAIGKLVERYPVLENVPIADVLNGNWEGVGYQALEVADRLLIAKLAGNPIFENIPVSDLLKGDWQGALGSAAQQQLQKLLAKYPKLSNLPADKLFPIVNGAIAGDWDSVIRQASEIALQKGLDIASQELLKAYPQLANTPLGALPIDQLTVGNLNALADKPLGTIPKIANRYISQLGNLSQTPGTMLVVDSAAILLTGDVFGRLDIAYAGETETPITRVLTGGTRNQVFLPEPCTETSCKHFEIADVFGSFPGGIGNVQGKAWIQGSSQSVPGGKGFLAAVNGGRERTGVAAWTTDAHVKLSLEDIKEGGGGEPATAQVWMNFQVCIYPPFLGEHCTPHFLSMPTPWKVQEGGLILVFSRSTPPDFIQDERHRSTARLERQYRREARRESPEATTNLTPCTQAVIQAVPKSIASYASQSVPLILEEARKAGLTPAQTAYVLATVHHESQMGRWMYELGRGQGKSYGHWYGRGYVQLTWESNYRYWSNRLGVDLIKNPELAARPDLAAKITVYGMKEGTFTGVGLDRYINSSKADFYNARRIVNDNDRNSSIANYAQQYYSVLKSCSREQKNSLPKGSSTNKKIVSAIDRMKGFSSRNIPGTSNGRVACAAVVNKVLEEAGYQRLGGNGWLSVLAVEQDLKNGRGQAISASQAMPGDIIIVADNELPGGKQHIGFCLNKGCTKTISNSSGSASFSWISDGKFSPSYRGRRVSHYRMVK